MRKWFGAGLLVIVASSAWAFHCNKSKNIHDCGFVQNSYGERVSWKYKGKITLYIHESVPAELRGAVFSAAATWEKSLGHKLFNIVTENMTGPIEPRQDGKNVIYFMDTWETQKYTEQARTSIYWNGDQIVEADIRINSKDFKFYWKPQQQSLSKVNFEALVLHEMGHVLGLKHEDVKESVMATYLPSGQDRIHLAATDINHLQCEYRL